MVAGSQVAHVLAYRWVYPQAQVRLAALLASGHGYMLGGFLGYLPLMLGVVGGMELIAFVWMVVCDVRRSRQAAVPAWAFGLMPPVGFAIQEFLERWFAGVASPWQVVMEPTFRIGLLLQIPFALVAYLLTRFLSRVAATVGRALRQSYQPTIVALSVRWAVRAAELPRTSALARCCAGRGPPFLSASS